MQKELKVKIRESKDIYRRKLENKLQQNNMREVWSGMKLITGYNVASQLMEENQARADELNLFLNRFESSTSAQPFPFPATSSPAVLPAHHTMAPPPPQSSLPPLCPSPRIFNPQTVTHQYHLGPGEVAAEEAPGG